MYIMFTSLLTPYIWLCQVHTMMMVNQNPEGNFYLFSELIWYCPCFLVVAMWCDVNSRAWTRHDPQQNHTICTYTTNTNKPPQQQQLTAFAELCTHSLSNKSSKTKPLALCVNLRIKNAYCLFLSKVQSTVSESVPEEGWGANWGNPLWIHINPQAGLL